MTQPMDQEVRQAAIANLDTSFFIEAGAGTGKTTVLVGRVLEIIRTGRAEIGQIVVLTFTEKAAGELRDRIRGELYEEIGRGDTDGYARRALVSLDVAHVETIHAFTSSLLREHPLQSGIDPNFKQLDEITEDIDFDDRWHAWLWADAPDVVPVLRQCIELGLRIDEDLRSVAKHFCRHREIAPHWSAAARPDPNECLGRLRLLLNEAAASVAHCTRDTDQSVKAVEAVNEQLAEREPQYEHQLERTLFELQVVPRRGGASNWTNQEQRERLYGLLQQIEQTVTEYQEALRRHVTGDVARVLWDFAQETGRARIREGVLTFDDLLIEARRLVRDDEGVRRNLQQRYRFLLVDEFQDTDPLQAEIIMLLAALAPAGANAGRWLDLDIAPGKLLVVGDPKQSIYRFRRADIAVYAAVKANFERMEQAAAGARVVILSQNFRSVPRILDWVNEVFSVTIQSVPGHPEVQPAYHPLQANRPDVGRGVIHLYPRVPLGDAPIALVRREEADAIARMLLALVQRGNATKDPSADGPLAMSYRDICLLVENRTALETYTDALTQYGIPFISDGGTLFQRQEVRDLAAILRALDDPTDMTSLVAALKSEAFACSDEELLRYRTAGGRFDIFGEPISGDPVADAIACLRSLHDRKAGLGLAAFVDLVVRESFLVEALMIDSPDRQRAANLKLIAQRARDFASKEMDSLRPFIRWISSRQDLRPREAESQLSDTDDDIVRVMTIHGAKGLEFGAVVLSKLAGGTSRELPEYIVDREGGLLEFRVGREHNRFSSPGFDRAWHTESQFIDAEEHRKLYVAATRARDYLIVPVYKPDGYPGKHALLPMIPSWQSVVADSMNATVASAQTLIDDQIPTRSPVAIEAPRIPDNLVDRWRARINGIQERVGAGPKFLVPSDLGADEVKRPRETEPPDGMRPRVTPIWSLRTRVSWQPAPAWPRWPSQGQEQLASVDPLCTKCSFDVICSTPRTVRRGRRGYAPSGGYRNSKPRLRATLSGFLLGRLWLASVMLGGSSGRFRSRRIRITSTSKDSLI